MTRAAPTIWRSAAAMVFSGPRDSGFGGRCRRAATGLVRSGIAGSCGGSRIVGRSGRAAESGGRAGVFRCAVRRVARIFGIGGIARITEGGAETALLEAVDQV